MLTADGVGAGDPPDPADSDTRQTMQAYARLKAELIEEGVWCGGQALQPAAMTTGLRVRDDHLVLHEGPFVETSDQIIGYFLVDCDDLEEAIGVAARIPAARSASIEIRPIWDYEALV